MMSELMFQPVLPWPALIVLFALLVGGCAALAVLTPARRTRWLLRGGALLVLATSFTRPGVPLETVSQSTAAAADVFVLVDTTASIVAEDYDGQRPRLDGVKEDMESLLEQLPGARVSMVTFGSSAAVRVPLTTDHSAFASAIETVGPEVTLYSGGSSVTEARTLLLERLAAAEEQNPDNARLVYYFGDGEQTARTAPESMSEIAAQIDGGAVFGYGTESGGPMKETQSYYSTRDDGTYITDRTTGDRALSVIDEDQLRTIAADLGVDYHHRAAGTPLSAVHTAPQFEEMLVDAESFGGVTEYFWIPLLAVFAWIVAEATLAMRRVRALARIGTAPPAAAAVGTPAPGTPAAGAPGPGAAPPGAPAQHPVRPAAPHNPAGPSPARPSAARPGATTPGASWTP